MELAGTQLAVQRLINRLCDSRARLQVAAARLLLRLHLAQRHASLGVGRRRPLLTPRLEVEVLVLA